MRSCLKAQCAFAARKKLFATRSNSDAASEHVSNVASALLGLVLIGVVGCGDSAESPGRVSSMRADPVLDGGAPAESSKNEPSLDRVWQCPSDTMSARVSVRYSVRVVDFASGMPRKDVKAKACRTSDLRCEEPVATFVDSEQTGQVQLELPTGFLGFLEVTSDAVDTLLYFTKPIVRDTTDRDLTVPTPDTISLLTSLLEYTWDMDKGVVVLEVLDCSEKPQSGIHFDCAESGDGFYMVDGVPLKTEQTTMYDPKSNTAEGGFINVPPGLVQFSAQVGTAPDAMSLGSLKVQARARTLTIVELHP